MPARRARAVHFDATEPSPPLSDEQVEAAFREAPAAGRGKPARVPAAFIERMKAAAEDNPKRGRFRRPEWLNNIVKANGTRAQAFDALAETTLKEPTDASLRHAAVILRELGRGPDGGRLLRSKITQQLVDRLTARGR